MIEKKSRFKKITQPKTGNRIKTNRGVLDVPDNPIVVLIEGDGIGQTLNNIPGITSIAVKTIDQAVKIAYQGKRRIHWLKAQAGDAAREMYYPDLTDDEIKALSPKDQRKIYLPDDTLKVIKYFSVALKGPLTTPIGQGFRSINVYLRQYFNLYVGIRPVEYFKGVPAPNKNASQVKMVVFRENLEDVYMGMEFEAGSKKAIKLQKFLEKELNQEFHSGWHYGLGIKPMSEQGSKRLIRKALKYAIDHQYKTVTLMHKGNIMKSTEGAFRKWGYQVAKQEFSDQIIAEHELKNLLKN